MAFNRKSDEGSLGLTKYAGLWTLTAASTNDNTELTTDYIDRLGYESAKLIYTYQTALTSAKKLSAQIKLTDCDTSGGSYSAFSTVKAAGQVCIANGGGADSKAGVLEYNVDLATAERYIKVAVCNDLDASGTDVATVSVNLVLMGATSLVAS